MINDLSAITQPECTRIGFWTQLLILCLVLLLFNPSGNASFPLCYPLEVMARAEWESGFLILPLEVFCKCNSVGSAGWNFHGGSKAVASTLEWSAAPTTTLPWPQMDALSEKGIFSNFVSLLWVMVCILLTFCPLGHSVLITQTNKTQHLSCALQFSKHFATNHLSCIWKENNTINISPLKMRRIMLREQLWANFQGPTVGHPQGGGIFWLQILCSFQKN